MRMTKMRVLVVDDEPEYRNLLADMVTRFFLSVSMPPVVMFAPSGEIALEMLRDHARLDLVVSDVQMPGMTGWEFYQQAVGINTDLSERFIFATGEPNCKEAAVIRDAHKLLLRKPFTVDEFNAEVAKVLNGTV